MENQTLKMKKTTNGNWVGRFDSFKIVLYMVGDMTIGEVRTADGTSYKHGFFRGTPKEKMLAFTIASFTHLSFTYEPYRLLYHTVHHLKGGVSWEDIDAHLSS